MASAHLMPECWEDFYVRVVNSFVDLLLLFFNFNCNALLIIYIEKAHYNLLK